MFDGLGGQHGAVGSWWDNPHCGHGHCRSAGDGSGAGLNLSKWRSGASEAWLYRRGARDRHMTRGADGRRLRRWSLLSKEHLLGF